MSSRIKDFFNGFLKPSTTTAITPGEFKKLTVEKEEANKKFLGDNVEELNTDYGSAGGGNSKEQPSKSFFIPVLDFCYIKNSAGFTEVAERLWDEKYEYVIYLQREKELIAIRIYADEKLTVDDVYSAVKFLNANLVKKIGIKKLEISETGYLFKIKPQMSDDVDQPNFVQSETLIEKYTFEYYDYWFNIKFTRCDIIGVKAIELNEEPLQFGNMSLAINTEVETRVEVEVPVKVAAPVEVAVPVKVEAPVKVAVPVVSSTQGVKPKVFSAKELREIEGIKQGIRNNSHKPKVCDVLNKRLNKILSQ